MWKKKLLNFIVTQRAKNAEERLAHLEFQGGDDMSLLLQNLEPRNPENAGLYVSMVARDEFTMALEKLDDFFEGRKTSFAMVSEFRDMKQEAQENIKCFVIRLRNQARMCGFENVEKEVLEQTIRGMKDVEVKRKALCKAYESVDEVVAHSMANETINNTRSEVELNAVDEKRGVLCFFCRKPGHFVKDCAALKKYTCKKCQKSGHSEAYCRKKIGDIPKRQRQRDRREGGLNSQRVSFIEEEMVNAASEPEPVEEYIFHLDSFHSVFVKVGGVKQEFIVDTGARSNIIPKCVWVVLKERGIKVENQTTQCNKQFRAYGTDKALKINGSFEAIMEINGMKAREKFYVTEEGTKCLLGHDTAVRRKIVIFSKSDVGTD